MSLGSQYGGGFKPRNYKTKLSDPETDSVMKRLGSVGSSALQSGLYALDTPGSIVRGGLGYLTGAKASDGDRISGRDLTNSIGITSKYDKGWGSWGLGLAAEIATDPLTYLTAGASAAATKGGAAAAKLGATKGLTRLQLLRGYTHSADALSAAGRSAEDIAHVGRKAGNLVASPDVERAMMAAEPGKYVSKIGVPGSAPSVTNKPLGALTGWGLPFRDPSVLVGTGPLAQRFAGGLDSTLGTIKYGTTLGRWGNALFDHRANESVGGAVQRAAVEAGHPAYEAAQREGRQYFSDMTRQLDEGIQSGVPEPDLLRGTRDVVEGVGRENPGLQSPSARAAGLTMRDAERQQMLRNRALGIDDANLNDPFVGYGPRQGLDVQAARDIASGQVPTTRSLTNPQMITRNNLPVAASENFHRDEVWRGIPGGTNQANDIVNQFAGTNLPTRQVERTVQRQMLRTAQANGHVVDRPMIRALRLKSEQLGERLPQLPVDHSTHGIGLFSNNEVANAARSAESFAQKQRTAATIYGVIKNEARGTHTLASDAVPVSKVLDDLGLTYNRLGDANSFVPAEGALVHAWQTLAHQGAGPIAPYQYAPAGVLRNAVGRYAIPRNVYNDLIASHGKWSTPEVLKGPLGFGKDLTSTFKNFVYPLWPASNVRNLASGLINNVATGANLGDHGLSLGILRDTAKADAIRKYLPELPAGLSDEQARAFAREKGFTDAKVFNGHAGANDLENNLALRLQGHAPGRVTPDVPGANRTGGGNMVQDTAGLIGGSLLDQLRATGRMFQSPIGPTGLRSPVKNPFRGDGPLAMEGVWGHGNTDFPALQAGRKVGTNIEDFLRMGKYLAERRKGFSGEMAGDSVRNIHFDYDQLTKFEKNAMRTAFPFYTFMRKNAPLQAHYLAHYPFYPLTQMRTMEGLRDQSGGYTPAYLNGGAAVPIPGGTGPNQRYISGFGTPLEEAMERFQFRNGRPDAVGTLQKFLASGNPFIKAPLEQVFDRQLSTGRPLSELRAQGLVKKVGGYFGDDNPQLPAQILANSPLSRFASAFDKATDDRKPLWARALNLGSGVKLTDVDVQRQKAIEASVERNKILSSMPHIASYTHYYPKRGEEGNLTPEEVEMLRLIPAMRERAIQARKGQGQQIGVRLP